MNSEFEARIVQSVLVLVFLLTFTWVGHFALARRNPRWQAWLWRVTTLAIAVTLISTFLPPVYELRVLPNQVSQPSLSRIQMFSAALREHGNHEGSKVELASLPNEAQWHTELQTAVSRTPDNTATNEVTEVPSSDGDQANSAIVGESLTTSQPPQSRSDNWNWEQATISVYLCGVLILLSRLTISYLLGRIAVIRAKPISIELQSTLHQYLSAANVANIPVRISSDVQSPVLCGVIQPTILLPVYMQYAPVDPKDLGGVIAHEAAHASNADPSWDLLVAIVMALIWPIPLAWLVRNAHRYACERVSDQLAIASVGNLAAYQGLVARIALHVHRVSFMSGLAMARRPEVCRRLTSMAQCSGAPKLGRVSLLMSVLILTTATLVSFGMLKAVAFETPDAGPAENSPAPAQNKIDNASEPPAPTRFTEASGLLTTSSSPFRPTDDADVRIRVVATSIQAILDDLEWLINEGTNVKVQRDWARIKPDVFGAFTEGLSETLPFELDLAIRNGSLGTELCVPADRKAFISSINGMGFKTRERERDLYEFSEKGKSPNFLRFDRDYAWTSASIAELTPKLPLAADALAPLLNRKMDIAVDVTNNGKNLPARKESFASLRANISRPNQRRRNEPQQDFDWRALRTNQWLELTEQVLVEAKNLQAGWTTSSGPGVPFGRGRLQLTALPGTELEQSLQAFGTKPSRFANVVLHPNPIISGKMNYPLDALLSSQCDKMLEFCRRQIGDLTSADTKIQSRLYDLIGGAIKLGLLDAFVDLHRDGTDDPAFVCAIRTANATITEEIFPLLDQSETGWKTGPGASEYGGVRIHEILVPESNQTGIREWLNGQSTIYVGSSADVVWCAGGKNALNQLKTAIDQTALPNPQAIDPVITRYRIALADTAKLVESIVTKEENQNAPRKPADGIEQLLKYCRLVQAASTEKQPFVRGELKRVSTGIEGYVQLDEGAMKVLGTLLAEQIQQLFD